MSQAATSTPSLSSSCSFFNSAHSTSTANTDISSDPSHESLPNPCLKRLGRRGIDRLHCILFTTEQSTEFMTWWTETQWYTQNTEKNITWTVRKKHAQVWEYFEPAACLKTGDPWVYCTRCDEVLSHPSARGTGTSSMTRHIATKSCLARAKLFGKPTVLEKQATRRPVCRKITTKIVTLSNATRFRPRLKLWFLMVALY
jgi:hypothetical protein